MKIVIIGLTIFIIIYYFRYRKYINPYKLIMVFGKKGSGKSTFLIKQGKYYQKKGYAVYTNIEDCTLPNIRIIDINDLGNFIPEQNSVLLIDEAGIIFDNRNWKRFTEEKRDFFKFQRHYKVICYLASQTYDIDSKLRDLCDSLILVQNIGIVYTLVRPIRKAITLTEAVAEGESRIAENLKFKSPLSWKIFKNIKYSRYFDSFVVPEKPLIKYSLIENNSKLPNS